MPQNHNHQPAAPAELSPEERAIFTIAKVDEWRHRQISILAGLRANARDSQDTQYADDFYSTIDSTLEDFLHEQGIDQNSPNYSEVRQLFYDARIGNDQDGGISNHVWENSPKARGVDQNDEKSQRAVFAERIADRVGVDSDDEEPDTDSAELDPEKVAAIDELEGPLGELRDRMAAATAKRQDRLFGKGSKKHAQLKAEYEAMVNELGRRHLALHEDFSEEDKNLVATTVLFDEQAKLRNETIAELEGKPLGKFIKWMNKGNVATRIAKGVGLGAVAGITGSFVAGAVGAGIVAGGAVAATRFARNFAIKDNKTRGMAAIYDDSDRGIVADNGKSTAIDFDANTLNTGAALNFTDDSNRMEEIAKLTGANEAFEEDTKKEQDKRRKSALFGAAMIGVGALAGYGVHRAAEWMSSKDLTLSGYVHDKWDKFWNGDQDTYANDVDHDGVPDDKDSFVDKNNDGLDDRTGKAIDDGGTGEPDTNSDGGNEAAFDPSEVAHDARWVERGEGWYQTFQELGIPQERWDETLQLAGPELHEQGWSYFDESANEWRISQPGRLSDEALSTIAGSAKQAGYDLAA
ncbi:MAG TPA: hypothetical protein VGE34_00070 [Candidatus Saccharimonadales bacterium]